MDKQRIGVDYHKIVPTMSEAKSGYFCDNSRIIVYLSIVKNDSQVTI